MPHLVEIDTTISSSLRNFGEGFERMIIRTALLIIITLGSFLTYGQFEDVQLNMDGDWHELTSDQGISIDYKFEVCDQYGRQVGKYVLRVENTSSLAKSVTFAVEQYQNGDCINCHRIENEEYQTAVSIDANSVVEGVCGQNNRELEFFSHFIVMVPGMSGKHLTNLVVTNLEIE